MTAGNASGVNDGAAALITALEVATMCIGVGQGIARRAWAGLTSVRRQGKLLVMQSPQSVTFMHP